MPMLISMIEIDRSKRLAFVMNRSFDPVPSEFQTR